MITLLLGLKVGVTLLRYKHEDSNIVRGRATERVHNARTNDPLYPKSI
jgi:hypothetical protein